MQDPIEALTGTSSPSTMVKVSLNSEAESRNLPSIAPRGPHRLYLQGWVPFIQEAVPPFDPPASLSSPWCDPEANLETIGFSKVNVTSVEFRTKKWDSEGYLELMKLLLSE